MYLDNIFLRRGGRPSEGRRGRNLPETRTAHAHTSVHSHKAERKTMLFCRLCLWLRTVLHLIPRSTHTEIMATTLLSLLVLHPKWAYYILFAIAGGRGEAGWMIGSISNDNKKVWYSCHEKRYLILWRKTNLVKCCYLCEAHYLTKWYECLSVEG